MKLFKFLIWPLIIIILLILTGCQKDDPDLDKTSDSTENTENLVKFQDGDIIPDQYIIVYKDAFINDQYKRAPLPSERELLMKKTTFKLLSDFKIPDNAVIHHYGNAVNGFSGKLNADEVILLKQDPRIAYIEQDRFINVGKPVNKNPQPDVQTTPWGITRVGGFTESASNTSVVWIIDTGIDLDHPDLNVDVSKSVSFISNTSPNDQNGHGTHVAGTIGAKNNNIGVVGIAAGCKLVSVRVLGASGSGTASGVIAGINHVATYGKAGDVANMSLGGSALQALDDAVKNAAAKGIYFAVAAGNEGRNAVYYSPARANGTNIYTVSAMNNKDMWASWSNFGNPPIDFCAPGVSIYSTYKDGSYATLSGTSMAAPHVAGLLLVTQGNLIADGLVKNDPDGNPDLIAHK